MRGGEEAEVREIRTRENLEAVDSMRLCRHSISFNYRELVVVDGEYEVWVAGHGYNTEAVAFFTLDVDNGQAGFRSPRETTHPIYESAIGTRNGRECGHRYLVPDERGIRGNRTQAAGILPFGQCDDGSF